MECVPGGEENGESPIVDIWAGINLATLCRHLTMDGDEQTHPWDPVIVHYGAADLNSTGSSKGEPKRVGRPSHSKDTVKDSLKQSRNEAAFTAERELVRHLFTLKRTARIAEKSVIFGRTNRQKRVEYSNRDPGRGSIEQPEHS